MNHTIELIVSLRVPDVVAATAFRALKDRLGFSAGLHGLRRHDYHLFEITDGDRARAEGLARALIERTTMFVNPNKHSYSIKLDDRDLVPGMTFPEPPAGVHAVSVLVLPLEEDDSDSLDFLRRKLNEPAVSKVTSGVLWELLIRAGSREEAEATARDITVARERTRGLLLNPHYQRYELI